MLELGHRATGRRAWAGVLLLVLAGSVNAEDPGQPIVKNYHPRDVAVSRQVWAVLQDRRGILYFGTGGGVFEYDGERWRKIRIPRSSVGRSLAEDRQGRIWVGAGGEFGWLEPDKTGTLRYESLLEKVPEENRKFTDVWQVLPTAQGVYFRSYAYLFRWDGQRMKVWPSKTRFEALSEVQGRVYTSQLGEGLQEIAGDELRAVPGGDAFKSSVKLFLHPFGEGKMLTSARNGKLMLFEGGKAVPFPNEAEAYLTKNEIYVSTLLPDGTLCVTTLRGGAVILERDGRLRRLIDEGLDAPGVLPAGMDREGALWPGPGTAIARVDLNSPLPLFGAASGNGGSHHEGIDTVAFATGGTALKKLAKDPRTGTSVLEPVPSGFNQAWTLISYKDPAGKKPNQLLAATSSGGENHRTRQIARRRTGKGGFDRIDQRACSFANSSGTGVSQPSERFQFHPVGRIEVDPRRAAAWKYEWRVCGRGQRREVVNLRNRGTDPVGRARSRGGRREADTALR